MNKCGLDMGLVNTRFAVCHGMHHIENYSTAKDIAKVSRIAMDNS